ncbi:MAG TPA: hypothetical protein VFB28_12215 [Terriglobales bacterium]|nr:hypothetical protein [Terriglobales bacterium]
MRTPIVDPPTPAEDAYRIAGLTFILLPKQSKSADKGKLVEDFVDYIITQGQNQAESLYYAKLPDSLQQQDQNLLSQDLHANLTSNTR